MERRITRSVVIGVVSLSLASCTNEEVGQLLGGATAGGTAAILTSKMDNEYARAAIILASTAVGAYIGGRIAESLSQEDQVRMIETQEKAMVTGEPQSFENPDSGVRGKVEIIEPEDPAALEKQTASVEVPYLKDRITEVPPLDLINSPYKASSGSNVRGGPGTDYEVVGELDEGEVVIVVGKVKDTTWHMVAEGGAAAGFVHATLLTPTQELPAGEKADETQVARSLVSVDRQCREVRQTVVLADGEEISETRTLCQSGDGTWKIA